MTTLTLHPLSVVMAQVQTCQPYITVQLGEPAQGEWLAPATLATPDAPDLERLLALQEQLYCTTDRKIAASFFFSRYLFALLGAGLGCYLLGNHVPDLAGANVRMAFNEHGQASGIAFLSRRFATVAGSPAAAHPDAVVVESREDLYAYAVYRVIEQHVPPLIETLYTRTPLGQRFFWATVEDRFVSTLLYMAKRVGYVKSCAGEVAALSHLAAPHLRGTTGIMEVSTEGQTEQFIRRTACCLAYRLEGRDYCKTCPITSLEQRRQRLSASMVAQPTGR